MANLNKSIEGQQFDQPLVLTGSINTEPERYIAEKPYELTKYEFSILKKQMASHLLFNLTSGATAGVVISILGKAITSLIDKKSPTLEQWEIYSTVVGVLASIAFSKIKPQPDKEKIALEQVIDGHFQTNKPRRVHVTTGYEK